MTAVNYFETRILSLEKDTVSKQTESLTIKMTGNSFAILAGHAPLLAYLEPATVLVLQNNTQTEEISLPNGGLLEVKNNLAKVFVSELK